MKILICSINYKPELIGVGKYTSEMAEWLNAKGHDVEVITAPPYYPDWKVFSGWSSWRYKTEYVEGVKVTRCPVYVPSKPSGLKRIIHLFSFALSSFPIVLYRSFKSVDVVFVVEPPLFAAPSALLFSKITGAKSVLHIQDFEVDAAFELGLLKSSFLRKAVSLVEQFTMSKFDCVSTISPKMLKKLNVKNVNSSKQYMFINWVDTSLITPLNRRSDYYNELNIPLDKKILLYSGNMGNKQGLEIIVESARRLVNKNELVFVMCGEGSSRSSLKELASDLSNIIWLPFQRLDKLNELLGFSTIHLLPQSREAADLVMPSKLTGMLSSGKPIVTTALPETQLAQVVTKCGMVVDPEDIDAFVEAIEILIGNPELCEKYGVFAREIAESELSTEMVLSGFEEKLKTMIG